MMKLYFLTFKPMSSKGALTLPLVKVKEKFQVTIPTELREALHLTVGDLLEATIENETIVLKPKAVVDRREAWNGVIEVIERVHAKQRPRTQDPQVAEEEITREIKAYRKHHGRRAHRSH
jgi:AbrB family looped-hinge helix DNA binding protein